MCGICGKLNFDRHEAVEPVLLRRMMGVIAHRGPDGTGEYRQGPVALGHTRLSIIDLSTGDQPMCGEDESVWIVYNGEIYNFRELRADLESRGHRFKSTSDTEVIVHLYEEFGLGCVPRLHGMFAFALWDEREQRLLLARDRAGIKPLYYADTGQGLVFGSELKCLLCDPDVERRVNLPSIDRFLTYYYGPGHETPIENVYKLQPGHYLTATQGKLRVEQYWDLRFTGEANRRTYDAAVCDLQDLLRTTVSAHMISDVPVGVLLSGGVDSTGVLRYAAEGRGEPIHSFTIGFAGEGFADERPYARLAAEHYGTRHQDITLSPDQFLEALPAYVWHMEEWVCEPPAIALYYVARLARQSGVKVLLSGEGADEAFGGYRNYQNLLLFERLKSGLGRMRPVLRASLAAAARFGWTRIEPYGGLVDRAFPDYYLSRTATPQTSFNRGKARLYRPEVARALGAYESADATVRMFSRVCERHLLDQMLYVDTKTWLPDDLLVKADKMTMATSVELRVPFLDARVLEFAASLPQTFKVRGRSGKRVLKAALKGSVPRVILERKKTGFPVPYDRWLRNDLKEFVRDTLLAPAGALTNYFEPDALRELVTTFFRDGRAGKEVFSLLTLELWHQQFLAPPAVHNIALPARSVARVAAAGAGSAAIDR